MSDRKLWTKTKKKMQLQVVTIKGSCVSYIKNKNISQEVRYYRHTITI